MEIYIALVIAGFHIYFLILEMFLWTKPLGLKTFKKDLAFAKQTAVLAANQGLYNGFLAAGLIWAAFEPNPGFQEKLLIFFFGCVFIAGAYGGKTVNKRIFFIQGVPALVGLVLCFVSL